MGRLLVQRFRWATNVPISGHSTSTVCKSGVGSDDFGDINPDKSKIKKSFCTETEVILYDFTKVYHSSIFSKLFHEFETYEKKKGSPVRPPYVSCYFQFLDIFD